MPDRIVGMSARPAIDQIVADDPRRPTWVSRSAWFPFRWRR